MTNDKKPLAYIAGKITGDENYKQKFDDAEKLLLEKGFNPVNPTKLCNPKWTYKKQMRECLLTLMECDAIYLLDDWINSPGATTERYVAISLGLKTIYGYDLSNLK